MQVVLVMFRSDGERRSFSIVRETTIIGRREDCDIRIPLGEVSRRHCKLITSDGAVRVEDMGSSNGTFHNGNRVQDATISPGDAIKIGPVSFLVQIDGVPADDELQPPPQSKRKSAPANGTSSGKTNQPDELEIQDDHPATAVDNDIVDLAPVEEEPAHDEPAK